MMRARRLLAVLAISGLGLGLVEGGDQGEEGEGEWEWEWRGEFVRDGREELERKWGLEVCVEFCL